MSGNNNSSNKQDNDTLIRETLFVSVNKISSWIEPGRGYDNCTPFFQYVLDSISQKDTLVAPLINYLENSRLFQDAFGDLRENLTFDDNAHFTYLTIGVLYPHGHPLVGEIQYKLNRLNAVLATSDEAFQAYYHGRSTDQLAATNQLDDLLGENVELQIALHHAPDLMDDWSELGSSNIGDPNGS